MYCRFNLTVAARRLKIQGARPGTATGAENSVATVNTATERSGGVRRINAARGNTPFVEYKDA